MKRIWSSKYPANIFEFILSQEQTKLQDSLFTICANSLQPLAIYGNTPSVRTSKCVTMKACGVHGKVDKRDKCGGYTFDNRSHRRQRRSCFEHLWATIRFTRFLIGLLPAHKRIFPIYGAFWRIYVVNVTQCVFIEYLANA